MRSSITVHLKFLYELRLWFLDPSPLVWKHSLILFHHINFDCMLIIRLIWVFFWWISNILDLYCNLSVFLLRISLVMLLGITDPLVLRIQFNWLSSVSLGSIVIKQRSTAFWIIIWACSTICYLNYIILGCRIILCPLIERLLLLLCVNSKEFA